MRTIEEQLKEYLQDPVRHSIISVNAVEREAGVPRSTLAHYLAGSRDYIPPHQLPKLLTVLQRLGFTPDYDHAPGPGREEGQSHENV